MRTKSTTHLGEKRKADIGTMGPEEKLKAETLKAERGTARAERRALPMGAEERKAEISEEQGAGSGEKSVVSNQCVSEQWAAGRAEKLKAEITANVAGTEMNARARGQREFLAALELFMHSAKGSQDPAVRAAAREWEAAVGFSVKVRLQRQRDREAARARRRQGQDGIKPAAATASPSTLRIRVYAAPRKD